MSFETLAAPPGEELEGSGPAPQRFLEDYTMLSLGRSPVLGGPNPQSLDQSVVQPTHRQDAHVSFRTHWEVQRSLVIRVIDVNECS
jgi:hypothetical protein